MALSSRDGVVDPHATSLSVGLDGHLDITIKSVRVSYRYTDGR